MKSNPARLHLLTALCIGVLGLTLAHEVDLDILGTPTCERFAYEYSATVDEDCNYELVMSMEHDSTLPNGDNETCVLGVVVVADDGVPYLSGRWHWEAFAPYIQNATGMNHLSIDWNPCGHPSGGFLQPHYDFHVYTVSPDYRAHMLCDQYPMSPVCDPGNQTTAEGRGFFVVPTDNVPNSYTYDSMDAVANMGMHLGNRDDWPDTVEDWTEPSLIFCTYNDSVVAVEPMFPLSIVSGSAPLDYSENVDYDSKTIDTLPDVVNVTYDPDSGRITVTFTGPSALCKTEFDAAEEAFNDPGQNPPGGGSGAPTMGAGWAQAMLLLAGMSATAILL